MADSNDQQKNVSNTPKILAAVAAAACCVAPLTQVSEGARNKAYLDPIGKPTICYGHTDGVHLGMTATTSQCHIWLIADLTIAMKGVLHYSPSLSQTPQGLNALKGAGDFAMNAGVGSYAASPMRVQFDKGNFIAGCNIMGNYFTGGTYDSPQPGLSCVPKPGVPGKYVCRLGGLVTRRLKEKNLCLTGKL